MSEIDDLRKRVEDLERIVAGVDRDQSDNTAAIQASHRLIQAMSITQSQHSDWIRELRQGQVGLASDMVQMGADMAAGFDMLRGLLERGDG